MILAAIYRQPSGGITITTISRAILEEEVEYFEKRHGQHKGLVFIKWVYDVATDLPKTRRFRDCWDCPAGAVVVDMPKARAQRLKEIRAERNKRLDAMDKDFMKALSSKQATAPIEQKMQALRDIPQTIDLEKIETPEALDAFKPEWPL